MTSQKTTLPIVSFIIPTLNAENLLQLCLKTIRSQKYPKDKIEIIVADGGSKDNTIKIAKDYDAKVINNPEVLHEPGKTCASKIASGDILFYTDSDNILSHKNWLQRMVKPFLDNPKIMGFLPQTIPAPDSNSFDRYLGYLCTDPFTWFLYGNASCGRDFPKLYKPLLKKKDYFIYKFSTIDDPPLFGMSQGVGTNRKFNRDGLGHADDLLAGIKMIKKNGLIAYIPKAGVYHYHVSGIKSFIKKYTWRIRNNFNQKVKGMGLTNRLSFFSLRRRIKIYLFLPYSFSVILPVIDAFRLIVKHKDIVMLWHAITCPLLASIILWEGLKHFINFRQQIKYI